MASDIPARNETFATDPAYGTPTYATLESRFSAVSWGAILAGGIGAAAMAMILMTLGVGLGLLAVSPWQHEGASAGAIGIGVIIWSIVIHVVAFGLGGYLAGRLRTKWTNIHGDEVYFRDSAHGFVTWALGILVSVCIMTSMAGQFAKGTAEVAAVGAGGVAGSATIAGAAIGMDEAMPGPKGQDAITGYFTDMLFRPASSAAAATGTGDTTTTTTTGTTTTGTTTIGTTTSPTPTTGLSTPNAMSQGSAGDVDARESNAQASRIFTTSLVNGDITPADRTELARLIASRTDLTQAEAEARVDEVMTNTRQAIDAAKEKAKQVADDARKAAAGAALWAFVALLIGAFSASYAAILGGRSRDL